MCYEGGIMCFGEQHCNVNIIFVCLKKNPQGVFKVSTEKLPPSADECENKPCSFIILHRGAQTSERRNKKKNTFLSEGGL